MERYDVVIVGGGPAGLAAALGARRAGAKTLLVEREARLGGILKQCIHDGFGLLRFGERLSGCEYATGTLKCYAAAARGPRAADFSFPASKKAGKALCSRWWAGKGCGRWRPGRWCSPQAAAERTARQVSAHGTRPAGVLTAGTAQHYINRMGEMPARRCVILGSGDIGLIMARRLTLEGAQVLGV